jgi:phosphoserine phosphatase RsbU/P
MQTVPTKGGVMLQMPLFKPRRVKKSPALDVHAVSLPATAFTGDFYFTHRYEDRLWFALGDVAGHGLSAAVVMAMIQEELEHRIVSCASTRCDPAATMGRLHEFLRPIVPRNRFATAVIGHLADDGTLRIVNAGHCPPLMMRADGRIEPIASSGPVVGMLSESRWTSHTTRLEPGEMLILYSDGLIEARSSGGEEFGIDRLQAVLRAQPRASARQTAEAVLAALQRHVASREDDLTLVVVRR